MSIEAAILEWNLTPTESFEPPQLFPPPLPSVGIDIDPLPTEISGMYERGENPLLTIWAQTEKSLSPELIEKNASDHALLTANIEKFACLYTVCPQINQRVRLADDGELWLTLPVDAVTVSANEALQGGGGQDRIVHFFAGPSLKLETGNSNHDICF
jgi:hypothetical protein